MTTKQKLELIMFLFWTSIKKLNVILDIKINKNTQVVLTNPKNLITPEKHSRN